MKLRDSGMTDETRWATFFDADRILAELQFDDPAADAVEFGCGYGTFTMAAAARTRGVVFGFDIEPEALQVGMGETSRELALSLFEQPEARQWPPDQPQQCSPSRSVTPQRPPPAWPTRLRLVLRTQPRSVFKPALRKAASFAARPQEA